MKEFLLIIKLIGLILSSASIVGTERMSNWENYLRQKYQRDSIHKESESFFSAGIESFKQSWQKFYEGASSWLGVAAIIIGGSAFIGFLILLNNPPDIIEPYATLLLVFALMGGIMLPLILIGRLIVSTYAVLTKPRDIEWQEILGRLPSKPKWIKFLARLNGWLTLFFLLPFSFVVLSPALVSFFVLWVIEKGVVVLASKALSFLRSNLEIFILLLSRPYIWLDIQVKKRKIESTFVVLGLLISASAEILGYFIVK